MHFEPLNSGNLTIRDKNSWSQSVHTIEDPRPCAVHLINNGITVEQGTTTVQFTGTAIVTVGWTMLKTLYAVGAHCQSHWHLLAFTPN